MAQIIGNQAQFFSGEEIQAGGNQRACGSGWLFLKINNLFISIELNHSKFTGIKLTVKVVYANRTLGFLFAGEFNKITQAERKQVVSGNHQHIFRNLFSLNDNIYISDGSRTIIAIKRIIINQFKALEKENHPANPGIV